MLILRLKTRRGGDGLMGAPALTRLMPACIIKKTEAEAEARL
jgi:hypothetical protein